MRDPKSLAGLVILGMSAGTICFVMGYSAGSEHGERAGLKAAAEAERLSRARQDLEMQKLGLCEFAAKMAERIECGGKRGSIYRKDECTADEGNCS